MSHHAPDPADLFFTRRDFLTRCGMGFGAMSLGSLFAQANEALNMNPLAVKKAPLPAKAKRVIHIFANGGASHVDTFDPKPKLTEWHGKEIPTKLQTERKTTTAFASPFKFQKYGKSGLEVSELFAKTAEAAADELCVIRSMNADVPNHEPSLMLMNCGDARLPRPAFGSWVTYGLGSENQNLPGFITMCPGGYPIQESQNWQAAFLPGVFQGTYIDTKHDEVDKLIENIRNRFTTTKEQRAQLDLLKELNVQHLQRRQNDAQLEARVQSFELAYRMQMDASDAFDIGKESVATREMYGDTVQCRSLLIARRLLERGVRFVQVWHGEGQPWDSHEEIGKNHARLAKEVDGGIAALLTDLKQRGMLDETLVLWSGEFGRTPTVEIPTAGAANANVKNGRDHNHWGFTAWMAGGGVKPGVYGATDEFGFKAVENPVHVHDLHATMLRLLGFDHEKLTYRYAGRDFRLTDVHGHIVKELIA